MSLDIALADARATEALGAAIARALRRGDAICLYGPLGAGKTTLARGLIRAMIRPEEEVPSPTFTLVQQYDGAAFPICHFDLYRLEQGAEIDELGLDEALDDGAVLIEWPQRLEGRLPTDRLDVEIAIDADGRRARLDPHGAWKGRPLEL
jgi:tRNA threonylcarbamoyladenosine biosynthesis protein TsaE